MPVKSLLNDLPTPRHAKKCEEVRHAHVGAGQLARPVSDFEPDHGNGSGYVHTNNSGLYIRRWSISLDPVEQEPEPGCELIGRI
jgi:hypothetical protein